MGTFKLEVSGVGENNQVLKINVLGLSTIMCRKSKVGTDAPV